MDVAARTSASAAALVPAGQTSATAIVDLAPGAGQWLVLDPSFTRQPMPFEVTGELPADLPEPEANAVIGMGEMYIELNEGSMVAGENLVKLINEGVQPHFVEFMSVPDGTTNENVGAAIEAMSGATPSAEPVDLQSAMPVAFLPEQSEGVAAWHVLSLQAGTYAVTCWITDPETGREYVIDTGDAALRESFTERVRGERAEVQRLFRRLGIDEIRVRTDEPFVGPLLAFFRRRERKLLR